ARRDGPAYQRAARQRRASSRTQGSLQFFDQASGQSGNRFHSSVRCSRRTRMAGLYLQEFEVGQVIRHPLRKSITESDNMLFSVMTLNPQPLHIDFAFAE